jgi:hypothetical protein
MRNHYDEGECEEAEPCFHGMDLGVEFESETSRSRKTCHSGATAPTVIPAIETSP